MKRDEHGTLKYDQSQVHHITSDHTHQNHIKTIKPIKWIGFNHIQIKWFLDVPFPTGSRAALSSSGTACSAATSPGSTPDK